jgi:predicted AlkP superfamily pyrophosphatase or phosphodiesterase
MIAGSAWFSMRRRHVIVAALLLVLVVGLSGCRPGKPILILLSIDGFRWDYADRIQTPNIHRVMAHGVRAERLIPSFPTKTFPNHYTIVTGLYPAHHGIVSNSMWDAERQASFGMSDRAAVADGRWWGGEPLWVTAQKQGLFSGIMYWPGSEAPIEGVRPRYWKPYMPPMPANDARVDQILAWIDLPKSERPAFVTGYFSDVDSAGHDFGPDSDEVRAAVTRIDNTIGNLLAGLERRDLLDRVNLVLVSDHGMAATSPDRVITLSDYLDLKTVKVTDINPTLGLFPQAPATVDDVMQKLTSAHPNLHVYRREDTPASWHYRDNPRIPPIVGIVDEGWTLIEAPPTDPKKHPGEGGTHGYDPSYRSMSGIFIAAGPAFRHDGMMVAPFENIHVYDALAAALQIKPARNDGDPRMIESLLSGGFAASSR